MVQELLEPSSSDLINEVNTNAISFLWEAVDQIAINDLLSALP